MDQFVVAGATEVVIGRNVTADPDIIDGGGSGAAVGLLTQPGPASAVARRLARGLRRSGRTVTVRILPDAEDAKRLAVVEEVVEWLADGGMTREGLIVGVGGGALTDLAGFVAAVYLRGVPAVYVPTTLLGAVDASIGGKSGVNVGGKNVVGVFRHPERVVIDLDIMDRLPPDRVREGLAEALKSGLIGDPELVDLLESDGMGADLAEVVRRSLEVKASVVEGDFREAGERAILNYGHTIGHAIEVAGAVAHGRAVAIGMVAAGRASALAAGFEEEERQRSIIEALGLPVVAPDVGREDVIRLIDADKKRDSVGLRMVLLERIGRPLVRHVDSATVDAALDAVGVT